MNGKIYSESANIYEDQARILYNYYRAAAEKIVNDEKLLEGKIAEAQSGIDRLDEEAKQVKKIRTIAWVLCWTIVGLVIALMKNAKIKELQKAIDEREDEIKRLKEAHKGIFRDYKVSKLGVAYVPVAKRVAYKDKSFVIDQSGTTSREQFSLQVIKDRDTLSDAVQDLQHLIQTMPIVESSNEPEAVDTGAFSKSIQRINFNDYFGRMDRSLLSISYALGNLEELNVSLPVVFPGSQYARFLEEHATSSVEGAPVFNLYNTSQFDDEIDKFNQIKETRKALSQESEQVDKSLKDLMVSMAETIQRTSKKKVTSAGTLIDYTNNILFNILKAPYDFYSPVLEAPEIERIRNEEFDYESVQNNYRPFNLKESSRVKLDLRSMSWVAEDGSRTTIPFGMNQIYYEVIAPIVSNLLKTTRQERSKIYDTIRDQKISYLNKWHQDTEDFYGRNRTESANIINDMRHTLSEFTAAYNTLQSYQKTAQTMRDSQTLESAVTETEDNSADVMMGYQEQAEQVAQVQKDFAEYMERLQENIEERAKEFGYIEYYDASLRDRKAKDAALASMNIAQLDDRRKPLATVSPLLAQDSQLLPEPSIDAEAYQYASMDMNEIVREALEGLDRDDPSRPRQTGAEEDSSAPESAILDDSRSLEERDEEEDDHEADS